MRIKTKIDDFGRMVIPKKIRDKPGIIKGSEIQIDTMDEGIIIRKKEEKLLIEDKEGILAVWSETTGPVDSSIQKDREDRMKKILNTGEYNQ